MATTSAGPAGGLQTPPPGMRPLSSTPARSLTEPLAIAFAATSIVTVHREVGMASEIQQRVACASNPNSKMIERDKSPLLLRPRRFSRRAIRSTVRRKRLGKGLSKAILFAVALGAPTAALAASPSCAPRTELLKQLSVRFSEAPIAAGLASNGALIEVLTSGNGSTWTIIVSKPNGASCLVAAGESWQALKRVAGEVGS